MQSRSLCPIFLVDLRQGLSDACDLSKAFDCFDHDFLFSKLKLYRVINNKLSLFESYISNRHQRVFINQSFPELAEVKFGVHSAMDQLLWTCDRQKAVHRPFTKALFTALWQVGLSRG